MADTFGMTDSDCRQSLASDGTASKLCNPMSLYWRFARCSERAALLLRRRQEHPAFEKLFLETEFMHDSGALSARRRPRAIDEKPVWAIHVSATEVQESDPVEYETDRARFLGRGGTPANPAALDTGSSLSGTTGPVLDPVFSLRRHVLLAPGGTARVAFVTGAAETRETATALADHFRELDTTDRAFDRARESWQKELRELGQTPDDIAMFNRLAGAVIFTGHALRRPDAVAANLLGQPGLWRHAISGDRPIVLALVATSGDEPLVPQLVQWHAYARRRGLNVDLVVLDKRSGEPFLFSTLGGSHSVRLNQRPRNCIKPFHSMTKASYRFTMSREFAVRKKADL